jgi:PTS system N-acetylglucosamine-specific IIC component
MLLPVGALYAGVYYGLFRVCIHVFDLATPGREPEAAVRSQPAARPAEARGAAFVSALGGAANLSTIDACTTRLRLEVVDQAAIDEGGLRALGARGLVRPGGQSGSALQVVVGPTADQIAGEIRAAVGAAASDAAPAARPTRAPKTPAPDAAEASLAARLLAALGGAGNVRDLQTCASRLRVEVADPSRVDSAALEALPVRGVARPGAALHVLIGPRAEAVAQSLEAALGAAQA